MRIQLKKPTKETFDRAYKIIFLVLFVVSVFYSFSISMDFKEFKAQVNPIGHNPAQYNPTAGMYAELGTEHLHIPFNNDTLVGHNFSTGLPPGPPLRLL